MLRLDRVANLAGFANRSRVQCVKPLGAHAPLACFTFFPCSDAENAVSLTPTASFQALSHFFGVGRRTFCRVHLNGLFGCEKGFLGRQVRESVLGQQKVLLEVSIRRQVLCSHACILVFTGNTLSFRWPRRSLELSNAIFQL